MSKFKKLHLPILVSVAMNTGNIYASAAAAAPSMSEADVSTTKSQSVSNFAPELVTYSSSEYPLRVVASSTDEMAIQVELPISKSQQDLVKDDPYFFGHLSSFFSYGCGAGLHEMSGNLLEKYEREEIPLFSPSLATAASHRWHPGIHFVPAAVVKEAFFQYRKKESFYRPTSRFVKEKKLDPTDTEAARKAFDQLVDEVFSDRFFGVPVDPAARREHFLRTDIAFLPHTMLENIYMAAKKIMQGTQYGDILVSFGNSPVFVHFALMHLASRNQRDTNYRQLISFPFSGSPNRMRLGSFPNKLDHVTAERLEHLQRRMASVGLSPDNPNVVKKTTYFIDVFASGAGPAYVMHELLAASAEKGLLPKLATISLNEIDVDSKTDSRNNMIANASAKDGEKTRFNFPLKASPTFSVDNFVVHLPMHESLDMIPPSFRILPEYNAYFWSKEYDALLTTDLQEHTRILIEYFNTNMEAFVQRDSAIGHHS